VVADQVGGGRGFGGVQAKPQAARARPRSPLCGCTGPTAPRRPSPLLLFPFLSWRQVLAANAVSKIYDGDVVMTYSLSQVGVGCGSGACRRGRGDARALGGWERTLAALTKRCSWPADVGCR
jgi:hypothetical protein